MYGGEKWGKFCVFGEGASRPLCLARAMGYMFLLVVFPGIYLSLVSD